MKNVEFYAGPEHKAGPTEEMLFLCRVEAIIRDGSAAGSVVALISVDPAVSIGGAEPPTTTLVAVLYTSFLDSASKSIPKISTGKFSVAISKDANSALSGEFRSSSWEWMVWYGEDPR